VWKYRDSWALTLWRNRRRVASLRHDNQLEADLEALTGTTVVVLTEAELQARLAPTEAAA
jgi:hypothetical protein